MQNLKTTKMHYFYISFFGFIASYLRENKKTENQKKNAKPKNYKKMHYFYISFFWVGG